MLLDLLAAASAAIACAGIAVALRRFVPAVPRWAVPAAAGLGMIGYATWSEYSWYSRVTGALPDGVTVLSAPADRSPLRPWTFVFPVTTRFAALDAVNLQRTAAPGVVRADIMFVERWGPVTRVPVAFDCPGGRRAELVEGAVLAADGTLSGADWTTPAAGDPLVASACAGVADGG
jgi:hypothetical protein